jgi:hypothetical protein
VAEDVLATTFAGYSQAMVADDRAPLGDYTTPSALRDSEATLNCGCLAGPMTYSTSIFSAPTESSYPYSFLAGLSGVGYNQLSLTWWVVFTKSSASSPWVIAFVASFESGGGLTGGAPYSSAAPPTVPHPLAPGPQAFVDFFQQLDTTGNAGDGLPTNYAHDGALDSDVTVSTNLFEARHAAGLDQQFSHTVDQVSPEFAQVVNGAVYGAMECFSMQVSDVVTSANGSPVVQPPDLSTWGSLVPPGSYAQLKLMQEDDECLGEDAGGGITLLAESGGDYQVATTPA